MNSHIADVYAVLLVGGMGTRLRSLVSGLPKPLASVGTKPFLELLIRQLRCQGICQLIMCTGYLAEHIENTFGNGHAWDVTIQYSTEVQELGTAGAVKHAAGMIGGADDFIVMNGDSFVDIDLNHLIEFHHAHGGMASMAVRHVDHTGRYGTIQMDASGRVLGFAEKSGRNLPGLVNAGVYVFDRTVFEYIPAGRASLEKDVFPRLLALGVFALEQYGAFIDIGTPEDYTVAQGISDYLYDMACRSHTSGVPHRTGSGEGT